MATVKYELSTKVERNGKERWHRIGVVLANDKGQYAIIDNIPVGFTGLVSFFEPKEKDAVQNTAGFAPAAAPQTINDLDDDSLPF